MTTLECRECHVICELVVSPWQCLKARHKCTYAFTDDETTYFGCLHKVFSPELDLKAFEGEDESGGRRGDPYGAVRVSGMPRAECPVTVERAYCVGGGKASCINPWFAHDAFVVRGAETRRGPTGEPPSRDRTSG